MTMSRPRCCKRSKRFRRGSATTCSCSDSLTRPTPGRVHLTDTAEGSGSELRSVCTKGLHDCSDPRSLGELHHVRQPSGAARHMRTAQRVEKGLHGGYEDFDRGS